MKRDKKDHPVLYVIKIAVFLLFVVVPLLAWRKGQNYYWSRIYNKESRK